jgi:hypothetical protein
MRSLAMFLVPAALALAVACCVGTPVSAADLPVEPARPWALRIESGVVASGYNDVRVPNEGGTLFSLSEDLDASSSGFFRVALERRLGARHRLIFTAAPCRIEAAGRQDRALRFAGTSFPANTDLDARYRFDTYRLAYRYRFAPRGRLAAELGATLLLRDAAITLEGGGLEGETANTGLVPLLGLRLAWRASEYLRLVLDADALAAPQGRAEDVFLGFEWTMVPGVDLAAGYRFIEGGADVDEVYNFALIHFLTFAVAVDL